jgi:hypothetical protein
MLDNPSDSRSGYLKLTLYLVGVPFGHMVEGWNGVV